MRACIAAALISSTSAWAQGAKLVVAVQPATDAASEQAKRCAVALNAAAARAERFELLDVEVVAGGNRVAKAVREVAAARKHIEQGIAHLYELRTEKAAKMLRSGVAVLRKHPERLTTEVSVLADGLAHLAAIHLLAGNERRGREFLTEALALAPGLEPDKRVFNPPMRRVFAREKKRLAARLGSVSVMSSPTAALVWIDGVPRGIAPMVVDNLHEGVHVVRVSEDGRALWGQMVFVVADAKVDVRAELPVLKGLGVALLIEDAFRAADSQANAPAAVAALGRPLAADQVLLVRVRYLGPGRGSADAVLYDVAGEARIARVSRELALSRLDGDVAALLQALPAPVVSDAFDDRLLMPSSRPNDADMLHAPAPGPSPDWLAWSMTGGGAALAITGLAMALHGNSVLGDARALGEAKETAFTVGFVGVGLAVVGLAASGWGGWMLFSGSEMSSTTN